MMVPIRQNLVPSSKWGVKCPYSMTATGIAVHNTYNDAPASNEVVYMINNDNQVSYHYAIDDKEIVQGIPENRNAWHVGDGSGKGNREKIGIEICYSKSGGDKFIKAEQNAAEFIASLLKKHGWGIDKVTKHQDYSGKYCPHRTLDMGWDRFINMVKSYMEEDINMEELNQVKELVWDLTAKYERLGTKHDELITRFNILAETVEKLVDLVMPKYGWVDSFMPEWARQHIQNLVDSGLLKGDGSGNLQLSEIDLKHLVFNDRIIKMILDLIEALHGKIE